MDFYGDDQKMTEFGDDGFAEFLDFQGDTFSPSSACTSSSVRGDDFGLETSMDSMDNWLDNFFEDPVLNDRMISDALQPPRIKSEHSYSLAEIKLENGTQQVLKIETADKDMESDLMTPIPTSQITMNSTSTTQIKTENIPIAIEDTVSLEAANAVAGLVSSAMPSSTNTPAMSSISKQPTIILTPSHGTLQTEQQSNQARYNITTNSEGMIQETLILPHLNIKVEPQDCSAEDSNPYDTMTLPPTPPSSNESDGSASPLRSSPPSPIRQSNHIRHAPIRTLTATASQSLFSNTFPTSGVLILTEEEKRTLISEGYPIPNKLPLTKQEEKNLKKVRRKIKNKISAQESRRKKKEYMETLEKRMECYSQENTDLRKKVDQLESNNRSLLSQLQKLQALVGKATAVTSNSSGTCLMVLVLCFSLFLGSLTPSSMDVGYTPLTTQTPDTVMTSDSNQVPMGPKLQQLSSDYLTPNKRSRVLMSIEECDVEYGPAFTYKDLLVKWFGIEALLKESDCPSSSENMEPLIPSMSSGQRTSPIEEINETTSKLELEPPTGGSQIHAEVKLSSPVVTVANRQTNTTR